MLNGKAAKLVVFAMLGACGAPAVEQGLPKPLEPSSASKPDALPPDATTPHDVGALLSMLDARARQQPSFTATYRVVAGDSERTIRIAYVAPDRVRIDTLDHGTSYTICIDDAATALRSVSDGVTHAARCEARNWLALDAALETAFPSTDDDDAPASDLSSGPTIEFRIHASPDFPNHDSFSTSAYWSSNRKRFLSWLDPSAWDRVRYIGEHEVEATQGVRTCRLSTTTGLVLEMNIGDRFRVSLVELADRVDPSTFEVLSATAGSDAPSRGAWTPFDADMYWRQRQNAYDRVLLAMRKTAEDRDQFERRITPVFIALHRAILGHRSREWLDTYVARLEPFFDWYEKSLTEIDSDPKDLEECERRVADFRTSLKKSSDGARDQYTALLTPSFLNDEAATYLLTIEQEAARVAFQAEIADPILRRVDERLNSIRGAH